MNDSELIDMSGVSVRYGNYTALEDVDIKIYADDFLGIIGPNGGGKTTLVKAILGTVEYDGQIDFPGILDGPFGKRIGYLPQQNNFDTKFPISVREVVLSGLQQNRGFRHGYTTADIRRADELLHQIGISEIAGRPIGQLSGGQIQRTLLCRSLISDPLILILDEPANFVDNKFERELYELLVELNQRMAIIMVSHDVGTITSVVKNIVCVNKRVHRHESNTITPEQLRNYDCPIQLISHGDIPHTVLNNH